MTRRSASLVTMALAAPLALSACSGFDFMSPKKTPPPCPPIYILSDAAQLTRFRPGAGHDLTDVELEAEITAFKGQCSYDDKGGEVEMRVTFDVKRGPAAQGRETSLTYFVAIPKYYPAPEAKAEFTVPVVFPAGQDVARTTDEDVVMRIPVKTKDVINTYEIYLGLQLTPEEMETNRRLKR